jgi:peptide/nickel transport system substrate-binding protein
VRPSEDSAVGRAKEHFFYGISAGVGLLALVLMGGTGVQGGAVDEHKKGLSLACDQAKMDPHPHFQHVGIRLSINIFGSVYDSLSHKTPKLACEPSLATAWRGHQGHDDISREFNLRAGGKFHSGDAFGVEDVKFSFDRALGRVTKSSQYDYIRTLTGIKTFGGSAIHPGTDQRFPLLLGRLVFFPVIPQKYFEKADGPAFAEQAPVGTEAYKCVG